MGGVTYNIVLNHGPQWQIDLRVITVCLKLYGVPSSLISDSGLLLLNFREQMIQGIKKKIAEDTMFMLKFQLSHGVIQ